ncbi:MAG: hypothetical protein WCW14_00605 [Candidatus Paceibacterota bacterium]|jgi:hypothetical protein
MNKKYPKGTILTSEYHIWSEMRQRCRYTGHPRYKDYGGRGISVSERWSEFLNFLEDMGERPKGGTLDRIDNDGDYSKGNCRWTSYTNQARNKRCNRIIEFQGRKQTMMEWSEELGMSIQTLSSRINIMHWDITKSLTQKIRKHL